MNQLDAMQVFARVAELGSFTQAADTMGLPKASASAAVQQLESLLGTRLLHRTTRKVQMTQDGQVFYERCKDVLADVEEMQTLFRSDPASLRGRLRNAPCISVVAPRSPNCAPTSNGPDSATCAHTLAGCWWWKLRSTAVR